MSLEQNTNDLLSFNRWYDEYAQSLSNYQQWLQINQETLEADDVELPDLNFCKFTICVLGNTNSGKAKVINSIIKNAGMSSSINDKTHMSIPVLDNIDDFPVLGDPTLAHIPTLNAAENPEKFINFQFYERSHKDIITPVLLTHSIKKPFGFYFLNVQSHENKQPIYSLLNSFFNDDEANHWQSKTYKNQEELENLSKFINARVPVDSDIAKQYGYDDEALPTQDSQVLIPRWRAVIINLPSEDLLASKAMLHLPAVDSIYYNRIDCIDCLKNTNISIYVINPELGIVRRDVKFLKKTQISNSFGLNKVLFSQQKNLSLIDELAEYWKIPNQHIWQSNELSEQWLSINKEYKKHVIDTSLEPQIQQMLDLSQDFSKNITDFDAEMVSMVEQLKSLQNTKNYILDEKNALVEKLAKQYRIFNQSDTENIYHHLLTILNIENFEKFVSRANNFIKVEHHDTDQLIAGIENARNVLLSGLKLDIKRCQKHINHINNSMLGLHDDLQATFDGDKYQFSELINTMGEVELLDLGKQVDSIDKYQTLILDALNAAYSSEVQSLHTWYQSKIGFLREPLEFTEEKRKLIESELNEAKKEIDALKVLIQDMHTKINLNKDATQQLIDLVRSYQDLVS